MTDSYEVVTAALTGHASTLASLADELQSAFTAAGQVTITGGAFGQPSETVVTTLNAAATDGQDTLRSGIDALEEAANRLRATIAGYEQQEATQATGYSELTAALEEEAVNRPQTTIADYHLRHTTQAAGLTGGSA